MTIRSFTFNPFQTNCFICHSEGEGVLVDAASAEPAEHQQVERYLEEEGIVLKHLLLTHGHVDHIFGCSHFEEVSGLQWNIHREDAPLLHHAKQQASMFGVTLEEPPVPTEFLVEGDVIEFGEARWEVIHTPGHSPGSVSFYDAAARAVFSGDVLFAGSIGRTDLWQGSLPVLMRSIFSKLVPLGDDVRVYSGHGPETTIGRERASNPFLTTGFSSVDLP